MSPLSPHSVKLCLPCLPTLGNCVSPVSPLWETVSPLSPHSRKLSLLHPPMSLASRCAVQGNFYNRANIKLACCTTRLGRRHKKTTRRPSRTCQPSRRHCQKNPQRMEGRNRKSRLCTSFIKGLQDYVDSVLTVVYYLYTLTHISNYIHTPTSKVVLPSFSFHLQSRTHAE